MKLRIALPMLACLGICSIASLLASADPRQEQASINTLCEESFAAPSLAPLRKKIAMGRDTAVFDQLADMNKADAADREAIREYAKRLADCNEKQVALYRRNRPPAFVTLYESMVGDSQLRLAQLHNGQITYGEYNSQRAKARQEMDAEVRALQAELQKRSADAEFRARSLAEQRRRNYLKELEIQAAQDREISSRLRSSSGGSIRCDTFGGSTYCRY